MEQHRFLALFLTIIYVKPWIRRPFPFKAAVNDLNLFHLLSNLHCHQDLPPCFSLYVTAALNRLDAHLRYLSEEMAFLALFLNQLSVGEKEQCRKEMLMHEKASKHTLQNLGKVIILKNGTKMKNLFGPNSYLIPARLRKKPSFLKVHASKWEKDSSYSFFRNVLCKMQVINDPAERAILLAKTCHNKLTTDSAEKSQLYQVLLVMRKKIPNKQKATLLKTNFVDDVLFH